MAVTPLDITASVRGADPDRFPDRATFQGLKNMRGPEDVARIRGKSVEEIVG